MASYEVNEAGERLCPCGNLGQSQGPGRPRKPLCYSCCRRKWPALDEDQRAYHRVKNRARREDGRAAAGCAAQLERGDRIMHRPRHHLGMAGLRADFGDPRPPGMTLSLVDVTGTGSYWGHDRGRPYRLSTDPYAYVWEPQGANNARQPEQTAELVRYGLLELGPDGRAVRAFHDDGTVAWEAPDGE